MCVGWQQTFFERACCLVTAAPKEKKMKRNLSLWLGLLAFALSPTLAQKNADTGKIHGHVINPSGGPESKGTVTVVLVTKPVGPGTEKLTDIATFPVNANGEYSGEVEGDIYRLVFRTPDMTRDREADHIDSVHIVAGQDITQDIDMSRKEYIDAMPTDQKRALEEVRKKNAEAFKANAVIKNLNADLKTCDQDFKDVDAAHQAAVQALGANASRANLDAKEAEIKTAKYTEVETLMLRDTAAKPDASVLWDQLAQAQLGLKKYDEAEVNYKKVIELDTASKKPNPQVQGAAYSGLGEIYARTGKVPEANAAYDSAVKAYPAGAAGYYKNEAVIFSNAGNGDASAAAADEAIKADPTKALPYYLKGQGLIQKATIDPASGKMILPPGCAEAYQKYIELDPNGLYAADVKGILSEATQTHNTAFGAEKTDKTKKKK
jgi:tetratricopeptide (TPR) repeat protein